MKFTLFFLCVALLHGCFSKNAESETFLIPQGLTGNITIYYNESTGERKNYMDNRRVYNIPQNHVLNTQFEVNNGWLDQKFYYVLESGNKKEISLDSTKLYYDEPELAVQFKKNHIKDTLIMLWGIAGKEGNRYYQKFVIGTYENPNSIDTLGL
ncbi:hypothetical protein ESA94_13935 [Lacibacter luteus]|uniref:DUF6843 domain-containing protein n=1 Tax=Lacibacter luteus TaxID=2508719 RepID=A0A4Q1CH01_9BACT|nr:hypothetical protein [Lacibacter luteus]RXK59237.1 hypothetical protein ESA94_13935 [Lacibacter luteus]